MHTNIYAQNDANAYSITVRTMGKKSYDKLSQVIAAD